MEAIRIALSGIAAGTDIRELANEVESLHPKNDTFPGEVLLDLGADALELSGASRDQPVNYEGIRDRYLPEVDFGGRAQHHKSHFALRAVAMIRAGVAPDLLEEVGWWRTDDLWLWSLYALIIYVRIAAERRGESAAVVCASLAAAHHVQLGATN